jgi:hypothetical protein
MKLFQRLLVAPAALGLIAPLAANASEVNIDSVVDYASPAEEVATSAQFSDVVPGDWAYTALQNLSESYGCVDNAYTQNLKSGQALTRYEAAALVNACREGGVASAEVTSDAARLSQEFGTEMAILKGRVDGLEYKVKELSAGQFSSSTKMSGGAVFTNGVVDDRLDGVANDRFASEYNFTLDLNTSFTGRDGLYVGLVQGNQDDLVMDSQETSTNFSVGSLFYAFPVGDFQITAGPLLDQDDVISATTSIYSDSFRLASMPWGAVGTTGAGAAVDWRNDGGFNASVSSVSSDAADATKGVWSAEGTDIITVSVGYDTDNYGGGLIYTDNDTDTSFGGGVYFRPEGFPTISIAYDSLSDTDATDSSNLLIGLDYPLWSGTASFAYQSEDNSGTSESNYELYYNYPVNDGVSIQAGVFAEENAQINAAYTKGYIVETFFSF